jgi:hypothetical protein
MSEPINDIGPQSVAESYIHKAMDILQGHRMGKVDNETASLTEEDRLDAVHWLLAAAQELLSQGHPDTNLQTVVERWIGTQASFITTPGAS